MQISDPRLAVAAANVQLMLDEVNLAAAAFAEMGDFPPEVKREIERAFLPDRLSDTLNMEGIRVNPRITRAILDGLTVAAADRYTEQEVLNIISADELITSEAADSMPLTVDFIKELHRRVEQSLIDTAGSFRDQDVSITGAPRQPPAWTDVRDLMSELCNAYEAATEVHPIVKAVWAHATFTSIHPFMDGNGRTGRLIQDFCLLSNGFLPVGIPVGRRAEYYDALENADSGDWRDLIEIVANSELTAIDKARRIAEAPVNRRSRVKEMMRKAQTTVRNTEYNQYEVWRRRIDGVRDEFSRWAEDINLDGANTLRVSARTYDPISFEKWNDLRQYGRTSGTWVSSLQFSVERRPVYTFLFYARRHEYKYTHDSEEIDRGTVSLFLTGANEPDSRFSFGRFDDPHIGLREILYAEGRLIVYQDPAVRARDHHLPDGVAATLDDNRWVCASPDLPDVVEGFYMDGLYKFGFLG